MREPLSQEFKRFAKEEYHNSSPLYEQLSSAIAEDPEMLALAAHARKGERVPHLFFAAVHFLLLKGIQHPLAAFYRSLSGTIAWAEDPYPTFRSFCVEHAKELRSLISSRLVQTNEVARCACLVPAFALVSRHAHGRPLCLLELGASAGLILLWDRYGYTYGQARQCGDVNSPVQIRCVLRGDVLPPLPETLPEVSFRVGVDLNPVGVRDPEATLWLRALIWPEHAGRAELLRRAIDIAQQDPPTLIAGDAVDVLPATLGMVPQETTLCLVRIFTALPPAGRERISFFLDELSQRRDLFLLYAKPYQATSSELRLISFVNGAKKETLLAYCENHGEWLEWLADANAPPSLAP